MAYHFTARKITIVFVAGYVRFGQELISWTGGGNGVQQVLTHTIFLIIIIIIIFVKTSKRRPAIYTHRIIYISQSTVWLIIHILHLLLKVCKDLLTE